MPQLAAVLTGDVIGSTEAGPDRTGQVMALFAQAAGQIGPDTRFTRFRGDGWQMMLTAPRHFLRVSVYLSALVRARDLPASRIAIGIGTVDRLGAAGLGDAVGAAFRASGHTLDQMTGDQMTGRLALAGDGTDDIQRSLLSFVQDRMASWSREQAEVVEMKFQPGQNPTQGEIAVRLGITRQAVGARLQAAGFDLIRQACDAVCNHPAFRPADG